MLPTKGPDKENRDAVKHSLTQLVMTLHNELREVKEVLDNDEAALAHSLCHGIMDKIIVLDKGLSMLEHTDRDYQRKMN